MPMRFRLTRVLIAATAVALLASTALASESSPGLGMPAPVGDVPDALSIDMVTAHVRDLDVAIQYTLKNLDKKPASTALTVYGPLFSWEGIDSSYPDKAFLELQVFVDQKPIKVSQHVAAFYQGEMVNAELARLRIDPLWMARKPDVPLDTASAPHSRLQAAAQIGLVKDLGQGMFPNWYALASHTWHTNVPAQSRRSLTLSYQLRPAYEPYPLNDAKLSSLLHEHCASTEQVQEQIKALGRSSPESVVALKYSIPIGLGNARMPQSVAVEFHQDKTWAGLGPILSFACKAAGETAIGHPGFSDALSLGSGSISILVLLPQE